MPAAQGPCPVDPGQMEAIVHRLATDLLTRVKPEEEIVLLGIRSRGMPLAERLAIPVSYTHLTLPTKRIV